MKNILTALLVIAVAAGSFFVGRSSAAERAESPSSQSEIQKLAAMFPDEPLQGGQRSPRLSKWLNDSSFMFIQLDSRDPAEATAVRLVGLGMRGNFCKEKQPSGADFRHFHRLTAPEYGVGHGGAPNEEGYWLFAIAAQEFTSGTTTIKAGDTNAFPPTPPPNCADQSQN